MQFLIRLVTPPGGAILLDPFAGSGSTGCAAAGENVREFHGIDLDPEYIGIATRRIAYWQGIADMGMNAETAKKCKPKVETTSANPTEAQQLTLF